MDLHEVINTAVEEVLYSFEKSKEALSGKATIGFPTKCEIEFGINGSYEIANYDEVHMAKVRVSIPIFEPLGKEPNIEDHPLMGPIENRQHGGAEEPKKKKKNDGKKDSKIPEGDPV